MNVIRIICAALITTTLYSCTSSTTDNHNATVADSIAPASFAGADSIDNVITGGDTSDYVMLYLSIADTGKNYYKLRKEMFALSKSAALPIDTMNRYYNAKKDLIVVADNDVDKEYRGEYIPRRFTSVALSLEYYYTYNDSSTEKNIALVTGIYEHRQSADSALAAVRPYAPHAFVLKAPVYAGGMR